MVETLAVYVSITKDPDFPPEGHDPSYSVTVDIHAVSADIDSCFPLGTEVIEIIRCLDVEPTAEAAQVLRSQLAHQLDLQFACYCDQVRTASPWMIRDVVRYTLSGEPITIFSLPRAQKPAKKLGYIYLVATETQQGSPCQTHHTHRHT